MSREQLYASFLLDRPSGLEIALKAELVSEATPMFGPVKPLPASVRFVEGFMQLREEVIPLVNLKKRLGLAETSYGPEAKVAVVNLFQRRYGIMFEDIREVFGVTGPQVENLDGALQSEDKIIGSLIKLENGSRVVEVLDLNNLFPGYSAELEKMDKALGLDRGEGQVTTYVRYVVIRFSGQLYGMPIEFAQEITFFDAVEQLAREKAQGEKIPYSASIRDVFRHGDIDGILSLRGMVVPVLNSSRLLHGVGLSMDKALDEDTRVLVLSNGECSVGLIVEEVCAIEMIPEQRILPMGGGQDTGVRGIYERGDGQNVILLTPQELICDRMDELKTMARLSKENEKVVEERKDAQSDVHHLITENSYLIFSIGKDMAVQLKDVQEIIEDMNVLTLPGANGYRRGVINLRGLVVPVVNVAAFVGEEDNGVGAEQRKLIICKAGKSTVALEVNAIVTIFKQEHYQTVGSARPELARIADTLDRLIVYSNNSGKSEHVLVVNIHNLVRNHLECSAQ